MIFNASVAGPLPAKSLEKSARWSFFSDPPQICAIDGEDVAATDKWVEQLLGCKSEARSFWPDYRKQLGINKRSDLIFIGAPGQGPGNEVKQGEMLCNAALRLHHRTAPSTTPVERVAYVFVDEADARAHLHELWLRELECWLVDDKGKRRLDLDYHPVPNPPAWVKRLEAGA